MLDRKYKISLTNFGKFDTKFAANNLILQVSYRPTDTPRFAIVVPSKFCKKAVLRNRTRRLVWQSLGVLKDQIKPGVYKLLLKTDFSALKLAQVLPKIERLFAQAALLR